MNKKESLRVVKINNSMRRHAALRVQKGKKELFDRVFLYSELDKRLKNKTYQDSTLFEVLKKIDLTKFFNDAFSLGETFDCFFFMGREAWLHQNDEGEYVYFSRNEKTLYYFDLFDLLTIYFSLSKKDTLSFIEKRWMSGERSYWSTQQEDKQSSNQSIIQSILNNECGLEDLNKLLKSKIEVVEAINEYAYEKMVRKSWYWKNQPIFFVSTDYIKQAYCTELSASTINQMVNTLCVIGALEKVPLNEVPEEMANRSLKEARLNNTKNHVSYYVLHDFSEVIETMKKQAKVLIENKIPYYKLTKKVVRDLFGERFYNTIYVQETFGKKPKVEPVFTGGEEGEITYTEENRLERFFEEELKEKGRCDRLVLERKTLLPKERFDIRWENIAKRYNCVIKRAKKGEVKRMGRTRSFIYAHPKKQTHYLTAHKQWVVPQSIAQKDQEIA